MGVWCVGKARVFPASMRFPGTGVVSGMAEKFFRDAGVGSLAYKAIVLRGKPLWEYGRIPRGGSGDLCGKKDSAGLAGGARFAGAPAGNMRTARHDRMEKTSPFPGSGAFFGNGVGFWHGDEDFSGALAMPGFDCSAGTYVGAFGGQVRFGGSGRGGGGWGDFCPGYGRPPRRGVGGLRAQTKPANAKIAPIKEKSEAIFASCVGCTCSLRSLTSR